MAAKQTLTIIQSTHASLDGYRSVGLLDRHRRVLQAYQQAFDVVVYSADTIDYSQLLGVAHRPVPWLPRASGIRHLVYYAWLVLQAQKMRGLIKVVGSNIPTLPIIKRLAHCPMVVGYNWDYANQTQMGTRNPIRWLLAPIMERLALTSADLVLVTAEWLGQKVRLIYNKPTLLLPNWVDIPQTAEVLDQRDHWLIVYAGRLHWTKGVDLLIEAFAQVKRRFPEVRLVICGSGPELESLSRQAGQSGVTDVELLGTMAHEDVLQLMNRAGIFVLPTRTMEGHPKALVEASAAGAACVATDVPGSKEVVLSERTGLLVPPNSADALGIALERLLSDEKLCERLGQAARIYLTQLSFEQVIGQEIAVISQLQSSVNELGASSQNAGD